MTHAARRTALCAALTAVLAAGCSAAVEEGNRSPERSISAARSDAWSDQAKLPAGKTMVGSGDSPCRLPVSFRLAPSWQAHAVDADPVTGGAVRQGPVQLSCEVDGKPAGRTGFLRVWQGEGTHARQALDAFLAEQSHTANRQYRSVKAGTMDAVEVSYANVSPRLSERKRERALAVTASHEIVILHLGGITTQEHELMVPALQLARETMVISK
ncbi:MULTISPECIES: lipoprotein [Streptomyces]|uniref:Lipoprotein n=1 Tax=Streptomyces celluloflavus TaxID=58344 RepID=A0ABW7REL1_9ACTN|nr:lipoprotein [Streptomyces kasugaensis]